MARELRHPRITITDHEEGLSVQFLVPGSKFGAVEIVLSNAEVEQLVDDLCTASVFMSKEGNPPA